MKWLPVDLANQYRRAQALGWIPVFQEEAKKIEIAPETLLGIGSRETNLRNILGDGGHGHGIMQIDDRSYPAWCSGDKWRCGKDSIRMGVSVFKSKLERVRAKMVPAKDEIQVAVACFNAGDHPIEDYFHHGISGVDRRTTGHDYSADVLKRAAVFRRLLGNE